MYNNYIYLMNDLLDTLLSSFLWCVFIHTKCSLKKKVTLVECLNELQFCKVRHIPPYSESNSVNNYTNNSQRLGIVGEIDATEPVLLERCAFRKFHLLIQGQNASYQIESDRTYKVS